jgi:hypothetical protein
MKSATLPSFWSEYQQLSKQIKERARKAYHLWADDLIYSLRGLSDPAFLVDGSP